MEKLIQDLKEEIIKVLNLEDLEPDDIEPEEPLFGEGVGLDSIDALELIIMLERDYDIKIKDPKKGREILYSLKTLAEYITAYKKQDS